MSSKALSPFTETSYGLILSALVFEGFGHAHGPLISSVQSENETFGSAKDVSSQQIVLEKVEWN